MMKMTENRHSFATHSFSVCVCVSGRSIPQVSKVPYLDPWQWNSPLCVFRQGKFNTLIHKQHIFHSHRHTVCNTSWCPQQVWKTKIWNVLNRFNIVQVRYQCGGKKRGWKGGEGNMSAGDSHIWPDRAVSWLFTYPDLRGERGGLNKCRHTHMLSLSHSHEHEKHTIYFLNHLWSTKQCVVHNIWPWCKRLNLDSSKSLHLQNTSVYLHCQVNPNNMHHTFSCPGTCS